MSHVLVAVRDVRPADGCNSQKNDDDNWYRSAENPEVCLRDQSKESECDEIPETGSNGWCDVV